MTDPHSTQADSDVEEDLKPFTDFTRPKQRGIPMARSRRAFVEASSLAQARPSRSVVSHEMVMEMAMR